MLMHSITKLITTIEIMLWSNVLIVDESLLKVPISNIRRIVSLSMEQIKIVVRV